MADKKPDGVTAGSSSLRDRRFNGYRQRRKVTTGGRPSRCSFQESICRGRSAASVWRCQIAKSGHLTVFGEVGASPSRRPGERRTGPR